LWGLDNLKKQPEILCGVRASEKARGREKKENIGWPVEKRVAVWQEEKDKGVP
jgi:hypothetical protein